ncbi:MAG TPA: GntR family transcriptional regulator [Polyangiaceae bacterium]|nr:GntR family transcriptional regulator [Polyangiaceae bacterium]
MLVRVAPGNDTPLYEQIAAQLRRAISEGKVKPGERLPSARELGESLAVHMHTVLRAYDELREEGLLDVRPGRGVVVLGSGRSRARLVELAKAFLSEGVRQGLDLRELRKLLGEV